jgi:hypothetical protein
VREVEKVAPHGTYERFVQGCDCRPCKKGFRARMAIKNAMTNTAHKTGPREKAPDGYRRQRAAEKAWRDRKRLAS